VLDDVADPADLTGLWPPRSVSGRVVITTRRRDAAMASHGQLVLVGIFTPEEAHAYLGGRCKSTLRSGVVAASMIVGLR
jgi:hypothetical protein